MSVLSTIDLNRILEAAVRAPSVLNSQPWAFRARGNAIELLADPTRAAAHLDPQGRELLMSCGAALLNLRLAVRVLGRSAEVEVLPDPNDKLLVARVRVGGAEEPTPDDIRLHTAIPLRRTSRDPFEDRPIARPVIDALKMAAEAEGARLDEPPAWHRAALAGLVHDADRAQRDRPDVVEDVRAWTGGRAGDEAGIPDESLGPRSSEPGAMVRDFAMNRRVSERPVADFDTKSLLLVLLTSLDSPADRIVAGEALERVLLEATAAGVSVSLLTQPTEVPELRQWLRDPGTAWAFPQALLRLGYGPTPPQTPRRSVADVLIVD